MRHLFRHAYPRRLLALLAALVLAAVTVSCKSDGPKPAFPQVKQGNNLTLVAKDLKEKESVYYKDTDGGYYSVSASDKDHKLVIVLIQVYNRSSRSVKFQVGPNGYILLDKEGKEYKSLDPFGESRRLTPTLPSKETLYQFIWKSFDLPEGYSIEAWCVFNVAKDVFPWQFRWNPVETVFVPFYAPDVTLPENTPSATSAKGATPAAAPPASTPAQTSIP